MSTKSFMKWDDQKPRRSYFDEVIQEVYKVSMIGAQKYEVHNWKLCREPFRYLDAADRHASKVYRGQMIDEETGCYHLAQVAWNALAELYVRIKLKEEEGFEKECDQVSKDVLEASAELKLKMAKLHDDTMKALGAWIEVSEPGYKAEPSLPKGGLK